MSSLFVLIPSVAIISMIAYKAARMHDSGKINKEVAPLSYVSCLLKEKLLPKFEETCLRTSYLLYVKVVHIHNVLKKNISVHYSTFNNAVNGREDVDNRGGATSFFLKSVADHKKKLRNRK